MLTQGLLCKIKAGSYIVKPDGAITCLMKCPVKECRSGYRVTFNGYRSSYRLRKGKNRNQRSTKIKPPSWNFFQVKKHLINCHSNDRDKSTNDDESTNEDDSAASDENNELSRKSAIQSDTNVSIQISSDENSTNEDDNTILDENKKLPENSKVNKSQGKRFEGNVKF